MHNPWVWLGFSGVLISLDQGIKYVMVHTLHPGSAVEILPFLSLVLTYNPGAAFSFLAAESGWQRWFFVAVAMTVSAGLVYLIFRHRRDAVQCLALALILGGALGNVIDRLLFGAVVDFVLLHWHDWHWPAFNLADSCITVGAALLIWDSFRRGRVQRAATGGR